MANQSWTTSDIVDIIKAGLGGQSVDFEPTYEAVSTLLDKIGLTITLQSSIVDHLAMFDDIVLSQGTTVEEYVHDLLTVKDYDRNSQPYGQDPIDTKRAYHYRNSDKKIELPVWEDEMSRAFTSVDKLAEFVARMLQRISDTYKQYKFEAKKLAIAEKIKEDHSAPPVAPETKREVHGLEHWNSLISNSNKEVVTTPHQKFFTNINVKVGETVDDTDPQNPVVTPIYSATIEDKATAEEFILAIQSIVEAWSFTRRDFNMFGVAQQSQPSDLVLLIQKGNLPIMRVRALAQVFNQQLLGLGIEVKVVDDFGLDPTEFKNTTPSRNIIAGVYAVLCDKRMVRYMVTREKTTVDINGNALRSLYTKHFGENIVTSDLANYVAFSSVVGVI